MKLPSMIRAHFNLGFLLMLANILTIVGPANKRMFSPGEFNFKLILWNFNQKL